MNKNPYFDQYLTDEINNLINFKKYDQATNKIEKYKNNYPNDKQIYVYESKILINQKKYFEAEQLLKELLKEKNIKEYVYYSATLQLADSLRFQNKINEAIKYYKICIDNDKGSSIYALIKLMNMLSENNKNEEALKYINKYHINKPIIIIKKASLYLKNGNYIEAKNILDSLDDNNLHEIDYQYKYYLLTEIYISTDDIKNALKYVKNCFRIKNKCYWKAYILYAQIKSKMDKDEEAINMLKKVERLYPLIDAKENLIRIYIKTGMYDEAINNTYELWNQCKNDAQKNYLLGRISLSTSNYIEAEKYFTNSLSNNNKNYSLSSVKYYLIITKYRLKKFDEALELINNYTNTMLSNEHKNRIEEDIRKIKHILTNEDNDYYYSDKQSTNYNEELAIQHIVENHFIKNNNFNPDIIKSEEDIRLLFNNIKNKLDKNKRIIRGYCDSYIIEYNNIGINNNIKTNNIEVICLPDTYNIITLYPSGKFKNNTDYKIDLESNKTKKLSQIDKFYKRYSKLK